MVRCVEFKVTQAPIAANILLKIDEIIMSVIPIGGIEASLTEIAIKAFTKLAKKLAENAAEGKLSSSNNPAAQKATTKQQLDDIVPTFQSAISDQFTAIFSSAATGSGSDNEQFQWLSGGKQLGLTQSQSYLQTSMLNNLKAFFVANFIQAACWVIDDQADTGGICDEQDQPGVVKSTGRCQQIRVSGTCGGSIQSFLDDPINNPQGFNTNPVYQNIQPQLVIPNAVSSSVIPLSVSCLNRHATPHTDSLLSGQMACDATAKTFADVDLVAFLESGDSTIPDCSFGIKVNHE